MLFLRLMFQVITHIEHLLQNHDFVILPNIGGFVASAHASHQKEDTFYPPCKVVGFNPTLTYNDGLLAQAIAKANAISLEQANSIINQEVSQITQQLHRQGCFVFGKLGTLTLHAQGIGFEPCETGISVSLSYGLLPVYFPGVQAEKTTTPAANTTQVKSNVVPLKQRRFNYAAACVAVILILLMIPVNFTKQQFESRATFVAPPAFEEVVITPQVAEQAEPECTPYHVVIGSFYTQAKALKFLKEVPSSLKDCQIVYSDNRFRIVAASFTTEELGNQGMEQIAKTYPAYKDAWLLHYNP